MITKKYSKVNIKNFIPFAFNIVRADKTEEFLSFLIWEVSWRFCKKNIKQIQFNNTLPDLMIEGGVDNLQKALNSKLRESSVDFSLVFANGNHGIFGSGVKQCSKLFFQDYHGTITECFDFGAKIEGIFIDRRENIFVCSWGMVFKSSDFGLTFKKVLDFSSNESRFLFETITETEDHDILIGEYGNIKKNGKWAFVGYVYVSNDEGETWKKNDFLEKHINKHIHILKWVHQLKCLILTEGDDKKGIWTNKSNNYSLQSKDEKSGWFKRNRFHIQKGGYTSLAETKENIVLGTDYYHGTNFIVSTTDLKTFDSAMVPDPYRRSVIFRMLYLENEIIWASLYNHLSPNRSLLMYSEDCGKSWYKFLEYDGSLLKISIISNQVGNHFYILAEDLISDEQKTYIISH
ncbi:Uncharacterized protein related to plant photosystem II stability/assembly factor [Chryseobacterium nakagawai]|uniref:Exo-alpha-sialidase n=1 Tax=Chryseobacterium nakagawai TaxID=1241982 RepID=A0AAD0YMH6_CHRNA|nr:sialidase family protein [Chryseobacterium nakagawai]AZA91527.1 exo-alpha-sialidase [Chryseobacterium nakagawai]VEH23128.1 Uncharacterized protein related to plant photosystem II stability/assembly factor [Chryseobacterium nakagawai]